MMEGILNRIFISFVIFIFLTSCGFYEKNSSDRGNDEVNDLSFDVDDSVVDIDNRKIDLDDAMFVVDAATPDLNIDSVDDDLFIPKNTALEVTVSTKTYNGTYSPANTFAVWIENESGLYIKTLGVWGRKSNYRWTLFRWDEKSSEGSSGMADAITGASRTVHKQESVVWDLKDRNEKLVSSGKYKVWFEMNETNNKSQVKRTVAVVEISDQSKVISIEKTNEIPNIELTFK